MESSSHSKMLGRDSVDLSEDRKGNWSGGGCGIIRDDCSLPTLLLLYAACSSVLVAGVWTGPSLLLHPLHALRYIVSLMLPASALAFSLVPRPPASCSAQRALVRALIGFPAGVVIAFFFATIFGAPISLEFMWRTLHWAALMSVLVVVPPAARFGTSKADWRRLFAETRPVGRLEVAICVSGHGAILGAWFGAWPIPLDWDRLWQVWPISCAFGAIGGYMFGSCVAMVVCCVPSSKRRKIE